MRSLARTLSVAILVSVSSAASPPARAAEPPDYKLWTEILTKHYNPAKGMDYKALQANDKAKLDALRQQMARVDVQWLSRKDQLAYWINLYNVSVVAIVVDNYPVESIRDISTDPIIRLNVFKKKSVNIKGGTLSLDAIENKKIRDVFKDARIHFAINCAAESCPPIRPEPYVGARIDQQLDDQTRKFLNGPHGVKLERSGGKLTITTTKIMDWFKGDFERYQGGRRAFIHHYASPDKQKQIEAVGNQIELEFHEYSWKLNDASQ